MFACFALPFLFLYTEKEVVKNVIFLSIAKGYNTQIEYVFFYDSRKIEHNLNFPTREIQ